MKRLTKKEDIELVMVKKLSPDIDRPRDIEDVCNDGCDNNIN